LRDVTKARTQTFNHSHTQVETLFPLPADCPFARDHLRYDLLGKITDNRLHPLILEKYSAATEDESMLDEMSIMMVGV
jgi:hypothetical protein